MLGFGRHIVFIVLGQNFVGTKPTTALQLALGHHTLTFAKQVRQYPGIANRYGLGRVCNNKPDRQAIALHAGGLDHATNAKGAILGCLSSTDLCGRKEKHQIVLESRSEEHTSELQSLMRISYAVFFLKKKKTIYCEQDT